MSWFVSVLVCVGVSIIIFCLLIILFYFVLDWDLMACDMIIGLMSGGEYAGWMIM